MALNIALIGYGRMGKAIEEQALLKGHRIVLKADKNWQLEHLSGVDVAIEFSLPKAALDNVTKCLRAGVPVVSGTTGWNEKLFEAEELTKELEGSFLYASNFSTGVNLFFELNKWLAKMMSKHPEFKVDLEEIHHVHKVDKPSGTAVTLAEGIIPNYQEFEDWKLDSKDNNSLNVTSRREGEVPGTHIVRYASHTDELRIEHISHGREAFARGAVKAAEWLHGKIGVFSMRDVLEIENT
jgi:4-hydroxy-tetrahydrodipicolinate reductase